MPELLQVEDLHAWYGESHVLHGMQFEVGEGELVTLIGRNGAGKTTTLRAIIGIIARRTGSVRFAGHALIHLSSNRIARGLVRARLRRVLAFLSDLAKCR